MKKVKLKLTPQEINQYNLYKEKVRAASSRIELQAYTQKAQAIINLGRSRYVTELENGKTTISGVRS